MATFLLESYRPGVTDDEFSAADRNLAAAAQALEASGADIAVLRTTYVPSDEACLWLVSAPDRAGVTALLERAALRIDRITMVGELPARSPDPAVR